MTDQLDLFGEPQVETAPAAKTTDSPWRIQYFDLETQKSADEVGGWGNIHKMLISVGVVWDSIDGKYHTYLESDVEQGKLVEKLKTADLVVGFNVKGFDYTVLQHYSKDFDLEEIPTFDMLDDVKSKLNHRLSLNHLAHHTLGSEKSADGLIALQWFKEGKIDQIVEYCIKDVEITRDLFLFGQKEGYVNYETRSGERRRLSVNWNADDLIKPLS